jgi:hypothetical protein
MYVYVDICAGEIEASHSHGDTSAITVSYDEVICIESYVYVYVYVFVYRCMCIYACIEPC